MTVRNLTRDVAAALLAPFDGGFEPTDTDLRYAENIIESLSVRGLRLYYSDDTVAPSSDGRIAALEFKVENVDGPNEAYRTADEIARRYFGADPFVLTATGATGGGIRRVDGQLETVRFEVEFRAVKADA